MGLLPVSPNGRLDGYQWRLPLAEIGVTHPVIDTPPPEPEPKVALERPEPAAPVAAAKEPAMKPAMEPAMEPALPLTPVAPLRKAQKPAARPVPVDKLFSQVELLVASELETKRLRLVQRLGEPLPTVRADPDLLVQVLLDLLAPDLRIVLLTARPERVHQLTEAWLRRYRIRWDLLLMRPWGDYELSRDFKQASVWELREHGFDLVLAIEDDRRNVEMFRKEGVPCIYFHSGYYD